MKKLIVIIIGLFIINGVNANNLEFKNPQKKIKKERVDLASSWTPSFGTCADGSQFLTSSTTTTVYLEIPCYSMSILNCMGVSSTSTCYEYSGGSPCAY